MQKPEVIPFLLFFSLSRDEMKYDILRHLTTSASDVTTHSVSLYVSIFLRLFFSLSFSKINKRTLANFPLIILHINVIKFVSEMWLNINKHNHIVIIRLKYIFSLVFVQIDTLCS